jgi:aldehyde:ferredoxin oxidoreductase
MVLIEDGDISLHDAGDLRGLTTWAVTDALTRRHGTGASVASIGPAGENLARQASTMVDKYASAAGAAAERYGAPKG